MLVIMDVKNGFSREHRLFQGEWSRPHCRSAQVLLKIETRSLYQLFSWSQVRAWCTSTPSESMNKKSENVLSKCYWGAKWRDEDMFSFLSLSWGNWSAPYLFDDKQRVFETRHCINWAFLYVILIHKFFHSGPVGGKGDVSRKNRFGLQYILLFPPFHFMLLHFAFCTTNGIVCDCFAFLSECRRLMLCTRLRRLVLKIFYCLCFVRWHS